MPTIKKYKICKRLGAGVYEKCQTQKFAMRSQQKYAPKGKRPKRMSDYGLQLIEKQKVRFLYGLSEKQFRNYVDKSQISPIKGSTPAVTLFQTIEKRLDNTLYRLGIAPTRRMARQMASHGHFLINDKRTTVPSYALKDGDVISVREGSKQSGLFTELGDRMKSRKQSPWLLWDPKKMTGTVSGAPADPDAFLNFQSVIEYYTR
ncbi:MAG: small subunit ribosomal protein S4 [Planctomycetota bacterium]|jgi:small subunit ribosomal protein S4